MTDPANGIALRWTVCGNVPRHISSKKDGNSFSSAALGPSNTVNPSVL